MGNFYTNISINKGHSDVILGVVAKVIRSGHLISSDGWVTICSEEFDQNDGLADSIMNKLTNRLNCLGVMFLNHDDDILIMNASDVGKTVFQYNSDPGYFSGENIGPLIVGAEKLSALRNLPNSDVLFGILNSKDEVFAIERQQKICALLNLPTACLGASSKYLDDGDLPPGIAEDNVHEVGI